MVSLKLDSDGQKNLRMQQLYSDKQIAIKLDEQIISAPVVKAVIKDGEAVITGLPSIESRRTCYLDKGRCPSGDLEQRQIFTVGPTLGADSLSKSIKAGEIGVVLVLLFMLIYYRLPGLVADIALMIYVMLVLIVFVSIGATLTLPGIAGFILSIGMAVDANVLIFERMKEEIKNGKTLRAAVDSGFHRALSTILDSNITTIIAAAVLLYFGSGPIKGFAVTLIIGILTSMFTAIVITRMLLKNLVNTGLFKSKKIFGA